MKKVSNIDTDKWQPTKMPTKEEYDTACNDMKFYSDCIYRSGNRIEQLLDELCKERKSQNMYKEAYQERKEIKMRYEAYQEVVNNAH